MANEEKVLSTGKRLRHLRERLGLSQREMAAEFKVTSGAIAHWESGSRELSGPALRLLELYERESTDGEARSESDEDEPVLRTAWRDRVVSSASASLALALLHQFRVTEAPNPIAQRVRLAVVRRFVQNATELRGLAAKLVQMVSYMDVLVPDAERALCAELEQERAPLSSNRVDRIFAAEFKALPTELFTSWSPQPLAIGSIGQVHDAVLPSGERVVVKVQYPESFEVLQTDLKTVKLLEHCTSILFRSQKAGPLFKELRDRFLEECDYLLEAKRLVRFRKLFAERSDLDFPKPFGEYSSPRVLTMSRLNGVPFDAFARNASQENRDRAAVTLWSFQFESVLRHGVFNTDPHPGNLIFGDDRVKIVDFGRVKELTPSFLESLRLLFRSVFERDRELFARSLADIGGISNGKLFDYEYAYRGIAYTFLPFLREEPFLCTPQYVQRMWRMMAVDNPNRHSSTIPPDAAFFHQLAWGMYSVVTRLRARIDFRRIMLPLLYTDSEHPPAPYSATEIRSLGLDPSIGVNADIG